MKKVVILMASALALSFGGVKLYAAKEVKLAARYDYSPDSQLESVLTPVADNGAVKTSYKRSYLSDGKVKVSMHKKNLEFSGLAYLSGRSPADAPASDGAGDDPLLASAGDRGGRPQGETTFSSYHDFREEFAVYEVASKGNVELGGLDKGMLVGEYIEKAGRKIEETDMLGNTTKYSYNKPGQLVKIESAIDGGRSSTEPSSGGTAGRSLSGTLFSYDKFGRLEKTVDPLGRETARTYDPEGARLGDDGGVNKVAIRDRCHSHSSAYEPVSYTG